MARDILLLRLWDKCFIREKNNKKPIINKICKIKEHVLVWEHMLFWNIYNKIMQKRLTIIWKICYDKRKKEEYL